MVDGYEKRLAYAARNSSLPEEPDYKKIKELVVSINEGVVNS